MTTEVRMFSIVLFLGILTLHAADETKKELPAPPQYDAPRAEQTITVDGILYEPVWADATAVEVGYLDKEPGKLQKPCRMIVKVAWDDQYLYLAYETFDRNVMAKGAGNEQGPEHNRREEVVAYPTDPPDFVEFFISFSDPTFFWEIHHNAANQFTDIWCTVVDPSWPLANSTMHLWGIHFAREEYIKDDGPYKLAKAVHMKIVKDRQASTVNNPADKDVGYTAEIRLPWRSIGVDRRRASTINLDPENHWDTMPGPWKMEGQTVSILTVCHDGDSGEMYYHSAPARKGSWFHSSYSAWPVYTFTTGESQAEKQRP